jgi:hypothetical protein
MDTIISTNILFYVLSIFILCLTFGFAILIIYIVKILKGILAFLTVIKEESEKIAQDIENIKVKVANGGAMFTSFIVNILSFLKNNQKKSKKDK